MKYKSVRERSIAVAANFPNFANKLPETKILKRIVKVLTSSSSTLAIYPRVPSSPPSLIAFISSSIPEKTIFYTATCLLHVHLSRSPCYSFPVIPLFSSYAYHRRQNDTLSPRALVSTTLSQRKGGNFEKGTRVKININTKNICIFEKQTAKFYTPQKFFSEHNNNTCKTRLETQKKHDTVNSHPGWLNPSIAPLFLPSHGKTGPRIKGEAKLR